MKTMLEVIPDGIFSRDFSVYEKTMKVAAIHLKTFSMTSKGTLTIGNDMYRVFRNGWLSGNGILQSPTGKVLAIARKRGLFRASFLVDYTGETLLLKKMLFRFRENWVIQSGETLTGTITQHKLFSRRLYFETNMQIPLEIRVFLLWLVILMVSTSQSSESSSAAA